MDWADDVAYSVHDVEDGVHGGAIRLAALSDAERASLCEIAAELYSPLPAEALSPTLDGLLDLPTLRDLAGYDGSYLAQAAAKRATSELVGRLAGAAVAATREVHGAEPLARYGADLVIPASAAAECALLKAIAVRFVMRLPGAAQRQARQRQLLTERVELITAGTPDTLDADLQPAWKDAGSEAERLRVVIDQVAQLTDTSAATRHARLAGATT
jgi:dGTPase